MQNKGKDKDKRWEQIEEIINKSSGQAGLSENIADMLDRWYLDNEDDAEVRDALQRNFDKDFPESVKPSREALDTLPRMLKRLGLKPTGQFPAPKIPLLRRMSFRVASAAAVIAIALVTTFTLMNRDGVDTPPTVAQSIDTETVTIKTIAGINKDTYLSDSTHVWVNENSALTYVEGVSDKRHVKLVGSARFDVTPDALRPFEVETEYLLIRVLGTDFLVNEYNEDNFTEVVLYRGSVEVAAGAKVERLTPGDKLTYDHASQTMSFESVETETIHDWRTETIFVDQKTIPELLGMIANYYDVDVRFDTASFAGGEQYMAALDRNAPVEKVISHLAEVSGEFRYTISEDKRTINIDKVY